MMILFMPRITNLIILGGIRLFTGLGIAPATDRVLIRATGPLAHIILPALSDGRAGIHVGVWGPRIFRAGDGGANGWCGAFCNRCVVAAKCLLFGCVLCLRIRWREWGSAYRDYYSLTSVVAGDGFYLRRDLSGHFVCSDGIFCWILDNIAA